MGHHHSSGSVYLFVPLLLLVYTVGISSGADHVDSRLVGKKYLELKSIAWFLGVLASALRLPGSTLRAPGKREKFTSTPVLRRQTVTVSMLWCRCSTLT